MKIIKGNREGEFVLFRIATVAIVWLLACFFCTYSALGLEQVTLKREGREIRVEGRLEVEAADGGLMILAPDGVIWTIEPQEIVSRKTDDAPFQPLDREVYVKKMLAELPPGFDVHRTAHYLVFFDTSREYAQWCGSLFERLYAAFNNFWKRKGFALAEPEFPLVAVVFADKNAYVNYSRPELGDAAAAIVGYFSLATNRMVMYDLTGLGRAATNLAAINRLLLGQPGAAQTTATIVHEATHQIAFNCGLHARHSDCPLWFCEGIAMFFETPDLKSNKGWRSVNKVNTVRLERFRDYQNRRPQDSLLTLLTNDDRLRSTDTGLDAYAESWALTYFLINKQPKQFVEYLELLSGKKPLIWDKPEERRREFERVFGDLDKLDAEFLRYMNRL